MTISPDETTTPGERLRRTLAAHGVKAVHATDFRGPTVIQHAFSLEAGQKVAKVQALSTDLALSLGLEDVRIVAPIPGTAFVGIEVPRMPRETVTYDDFTDTPESNVINDYTLPFPVGVGIGGDTIWADLAKLPHLLIAGSTGSGKSVALSTLIASLIDRRSPAEMRLWLIDPKRVELGMFADAPQVEQVATDLESALEVLDLVEGEMDRRYAEFERANVRNIGEWNQNQYEAEDGVFMPYHVVVIDEVADLMMQAKKDVEPKIVRIAQLARAAGVHLVLATQRPTVDVITGLIAANVVSRWTFAVRSVKDSMVALEQTGAQALYGKGDSLWLPAGADRPVRVQAVWTDNATIERIVGLADLAMHDGTVETSVGANAATEDDEVDLGIPVEDLGGLDLSPIDRVHALPEPKHRAEESVRAPEALVDAYLANLNPEDHALALEWANRLDMDVADAIDPLAPVDLEAGSNLEDPDTYNLEAELAPLIADLVERAIDQRDKEIQEGKDARFEALANKVDGLWRKWVLVPVVVVACVWAIGRIMGA